MSEFLALWKSINSSSYSKGNAPLPTDTKKQTKKGSSSCGSKTWICYVIRIKKKHAKKRSSDSAGSGMIKTSVNQVTRRGKDPLWPRLPSFRPARAALRLPRPPPELMWGPCRRAADVPWFCRAPVQPLTSRFMVDDFMNFPLFCTLEIQNPAWILCKFLHLRCSSPENAIFLQLFDIQTWGSQSKIEGRELHWLNRSGPWLQNMHFRNCKKSAKRRLKFWDTEGIGRIPARNKCRLSEVGCYALDICIFGKWLQKCFLFRDVPRCSIVFRIFPSSFSYVRCFWSFRGKLKNSMCLFDLFLRTD